MPQIGKDDLILEIGPGSGWFRPALLEAGRLNYKCVDLNPPADFVGDIRQWSRLGLKADSFDVIVAFEVVEHVDCFSECFQLLRHGGRLLMTTPVPHFDWFLKILEIIGVNQKRTSPHSNLVYLSKVSWLGPRRIRTVIGMSQWGIFVKK